MNSQIASKDKKVHLLFYMSHLNHVSFFIPLIQYFHEKQIYVSCIVQGPSFSEKKAYKKRFNAQFKKQARLLSQYGELHYWNPSLIQVVVSKSTLIFKSFFRKKDAAHPIDKKISQLIHSKDVTAILTPGSTSRHFHEFFKKFNHIPIVSIQHFHNVYYSTSKSVEMKNYPAHRLCVWGEVSRNYFLSKGLTKEILITGAPHIAKKNRNARSEYKYHVLFLSQSETITMTSEVKQESLRMLASVARHNPTWCIGIKLHPSEDGSLESRFLSQLPANLSKQFSIVKDTIDDCIQQSRITITVYSNGALDAMLLQKPVILYNYMNLSRKHTPYGEHGILPIPSNQSDLLKLLNENTNDEEWLKNQVIKQDQFLEKYIDKYGTDACEAIYQSISKLNPTRTNTINH